MDDRNHRFHDDPVHLRGEISLALSLPIQNALEILEERIERQFRRLVWMIAFNIALNPIMLARLFI